MATESNPNLGLGARVLLTKEKFAYRLDRMQSQIMFGHKLDFLRLSQGNLLPLGEDELIRLKSSKKFDLLTYHAILELASYESSEIYEEIRQLIFEDIFARERSKRTGGIGVGVFGFGLPTFALQLAPDIGIPLFAAFRGLYLPTVGNDMWNNRSRAGKADETLVEQVAKIGDKSAKNSLKISSINPKAFLGAINTEHIEWLWGIVQELFTVGGLALAGQWEAVISNLTLIGIFRGVMSTIGKEAKGNKRILTTAALSNLFTIVSLYLSRFASSPGTAAAWMAGSSIIAGQEVTAASLDTQKPANESIYQQFNEYLYQIIEKRSRQNEWGLESINLWKQDLINPPKREFSNGARQLMQNIGLFGTTFGEDWRGRLMDYYDLVRKRLKKPKEKGLFYNPLIIGRDWTAEDAPIESAHLLNDQVTLIGMERNNKSLGTMLELGFLAVASLLKGKTTIAYINPADEILGSNVVRARTMTQIDAEFIQRVISDHFILFNSLKSAAEKLVFERERFIKQLSSPINIASFKNLENRKNVQRRVCISGTSLNPNSPERKKYLDFLQIKGDIQFIDTIYPDWDETRYENEEIPIKDDSLVNVVMITDPQSYGAVKDVGLAVFRAIANGTYALIYMPSDKENPKSDYSRARELAKSHFNLLINEYPWISHYVRFVSSIEEMEQYTEAIFNSQQN
jgi:hypothetical protein